MNEYQVAGWACAGVAAMWLIATGLSILCQAVWAWIDDGKASTGIWLWKKINFSKWKYPVYNEGDRFLREKVAAGLSPFGYAKDKKFDGGSCHNLKEGKDYIYDWEFVHWGGPCSIILLTSALPFILLCAYKAYAVTLFILAIILVAYVARFARRQSKLFKKHVLRKDAHQDNIEEDIIFTKN